MKYHDGNELKSVGETKLTRSQTFGQHSTVTMVKESGGNGRGGGGIADDNLQFNGTNGLPRKFVDALRSLFSLLDESKLGYIKLSELEIRWKTIEHESNVPKGLIESLHSFQTAHDSIDFDRFCHAIAVCISRDTSSGNVPPSPYPVSSSNSSVSLSSSTSSTTFTTTTVHTTPSTGNNNEPKGAAASNLSGISNFAPTEYLPISSINSNHELTESRTGLERVASTSEMTRNPVDDSINLISQDLYQPFPGDHLLNDNLTSTFKPSPSSAFTATAGVSTFTTNTTTTTNTLTSTSVKTPSCEDICNDAPIPNPPPPPSDFRSDYRVGSMPQLREPRPPVINCDQPGTSSETNLPMVGSTAFRQYNSDAKIVYDAKNQRVPMKNRIINILKEWKNNVIYKSSTNPPLPPSIALGPGTSIAPSLASNITSTLDKSAPSSSNLNNGVSDPMSLTTQPKALQDDDDWGFGANFGLPSNSSARTRHGKRREARRHTITTGIDINTIKRLQQYEQEKEILMQGLEMTERGRDWYMKSISNIQNKIRSIGQTIVNPGDYSLDANQERINFQAARILTVNQHLAALMDNSRGFPIHMNLALRPLLTNSNLGRPQYIDGRSTESSANVTVQRLKEQNRLLTEEVSMKSDKITILEREKSALIRELFQTRSNSIQKSTDDGEDNTFM